MFEKATYKDDEEKESWRKIISLDFVSSDESCSEKGVDVFLCKPLLWQSERVTNFKQSLDQAALQEKSPLAKRQMKPRRTGSPSTRPKPTGEFPAWVFKD